MVYLQRWVEMPTFAKEIKTTTIMDKIKEIIKKAQNDIVSVIIEKLETRGVIELKRGVALRESISNYDYGLYITKVKVNDDMIYYHSPNFIDEWYPLSNLPMREMVKFNKMFVESGLIK